MRMLALILISALSLASSSAFAASYQQNDGTIVAPIQDYFGGNIPYSGSNLQPGAVLTNADLSYANLGNANLSDAILADANLSDANLSDANLTNANLSGALLDFANLTNADLTGAILANVIGLGSSTGAALYSINTDFTGTGFDPVAAGWSASDSVLIVC
jgi:hypothetical protein